MYCNFFFPLLLLSNSDLINQNYYYYYLHLHLCLFQCCFLSSSFIITVMNEFVVDFFYWMNDDYLLIRLWILYIIFGFPFGKPKKRSDTPSIHPSIHPPHHCHCRLFRMTFVFSLIWKSNLFLLLLLWNFPLLVNIIYIWSLFWFISSSMMIISLLCLFCQQQNEIISFCCLK